MYSSYKVGYFLTYSIVFACLQTTFHISEVHISQKANDVIMQNRQISTDIDICISVPLREFLLIFNEIFKAFKINDN